MIDTPWDVNPEGSADAYADGVTISRSQNIWVDHVSISDGDTPDGISTNSSSKTRHDGALDIVRGSDYVTLSNSFFGDHGKTTLVGNGDSGRAWSDQDRLHVTFTGLWWKGVQSRHPLTRFSQLHTYNNLMQGVIGTPTYGHKFENGVDVRYGSSVFAENNFHLFTGLKTTEVCGKLIDGKDGIGFRTRGNYFISDKENGKDWALTWTGPVNVDSGFAAGTCTKASLPTADITWEPPYQYNLVCAPQARRDIEKYSGAGRIGKYATAGAHTDTLSEDSCYENNRLGESSGGSSSSSSSASSSSGSSDSSSSSSASSSSEGATPVCTAAFTCDTSVGEGHMSSNVTANGASNYDSVAQAWLIDGAGVMGSNANSYNHYFKYMPLTGDFTVTARITAQGGNNANARAGMLAAEAVTGSSYKYAWAARYSSNGEIRASSNGNNGSAIAGVGNTVLPTWVRIRRSGNNVYAEASTDGTNFVNRGSATMTSTQSTLYVGFGVSSNSNTATVQATFDSLQIDGGGITQP